MKFNNFGKLALLLGCMVFAACEEDSDYEAPSVGAQDTTEGVSFNVSGFTVSGKVFVGDELTTTFTMSRKNTASATTVPINVVSTDSVNGVAAFEIPSSVAFAAGASTADFRVAFPNVEVGKSYSFEIEIPEAYRNTYAVNQFKYTLAYSYNWIAYQGTFSEDFNGIENDTVTIEHADGTNIWRVVNPYKSLFSSLKKYDYNYYADYITFTVAEDGAVTYEDFKAYNYNNYNVYGVMPFGKYAEYAEYCGAYSSRSIYLVVEYFVPDLGGGFGCAEAYITLDKNAGAVFGDFGEEEEGGDEGGEGTEDGGEGTDEGGEEGGEANAE
jgi:hypothetical protein